MRIRVNQTSKGHASRYELMCAKHLDERVLDGFVGFGGVAQILIRDARRAPLMRFDQSCKELSGLLQVVPLHKLADLDGQGRILRHRGPERPATARAGRGERRLIAVAPPRCSETESGSQSHS